MLRNSNMRVTSVSTAAICSLGVIAAYGISNKVNGTPQPEPEEPLASSPVSKLPIAAPNTQAIAPPEASAPQTLSNHQALAKDRQQRETNLAQSLAQVPADSLLAVPSLPPTVARAKVPSARDHVIDQIVARSLNSSIGSPRINPVPTPAYTVVKPPQQLRAAYASAPVSTPSEAVQPIAQLQAAPPTPAISTPVPQPSPAPVQPIHQSASQPTQQTAQQTAQQTTQQATGQPTEQPQAIQPLNAAANQNLASQPSQPPTSPVLANRPTALAMRSTVAETTTQAKSAVPTEVAPTEVAPTEVAQTAPEPTPRTPTPRTMPGETPKQGSGETSNPAQPQQSNSKSNSQSNSQPNSQSNSHTISPISPTAASNSAPTARTVAQSVVQTVRQAAQRTQTVVQVAQARVEPQVQPQAQVRSQPQLQTQPQSQVQPQVQPQVEPQVQPQVQLQTDTPTPPQTISQAASSPAQLITQPVTQPVSQVAPQAVTIPQQFFANPTNAAPVDEAYTLGAGDQLALSFFNVPEYNGSHQVLADGTLNLPLVGSVYVTGLTLQQAEAAIAGRYQSELRSAIVNVSLGQTRPLQVAIGGEVQQPGSYQLPSTGSFPGLVQAIQAAGGTTQAADLRGVQVLRTSLSNPNQTIAVNLVELLQGNLSQDVKLRDGDRIWIPTAATVDFAEATQFAASNFAAKPAPVNIAIVGEINRPGSYTIGGEGGPTTVAQAIQQAGGLKPSANLRQIQIRRSTRTGGEQVIDLDFWQLLQSGNLSQDITLQQGDRITIPMTTANNSNTNAETILMSAANLSPEQIQVNIVGEVNSPGTVSIAPGASLNQAILAAGGLNNRATREIELIRLDANGTMSRRSIEVEFKEGFNTSENPLILNNDIVVVGRSGAAQLGDQLDGINDVVGPLLQLLPFSLPSPF
jgi:polysaccharide biosynthesis/export protein